MKLSSTLGTLVLKSCHHDANPPIQRNILLIFASDPVTTFLKNPVDLSARDNWEQFPLGELVSLLNIPAPKNGQRITAAEGQETVQN